MDMVDMDMDIVVRRNSQLHWSIIGSDMPSALGLVHFLKRWTTPSHERIAATKLKTLHFLQQSRTFSLSKGIISDHSDCQTVRHQRHLKQTQGGTASYKNADKWLPQGSSKKSRKLFKITVQETKAFSSGLKSQPNSLEPDYGRWWTFLRPTHLWPQPLIWNLDPNNLYVHHQCQHSHQRRPFTLLPDLLGDLFLHLVHLPVHHLTTVVNHLVTLVNHLATQVD